MSFTPQITDALEPIIRLVNEDRQKGLERLTRMAEGGDRSAIVFLGLYLSEETTTSDAAMKWLLLANDFGSPDAAWNIAMIARERGDEHEMKRWIDRAAELGEPDARIIQGNGYNVASVIAGVRDGDISA
ncbi:hypothetical protein [Nitrospirillum sp. BR 11828]|uniref:hypothetical protein n=1 Tax=Nitrospirillum sp. BR 11828 TaxID=3104325 RepID=UPI002ACAD2B1|nr:hypothetical protein [Nitrospirillum sp. BR 11828]MDZ5649666.1 hypothetical protein [Nitrospirillum sp. BR 11828]